MMEKTLDPKTVEALEKPGIREFTEKCIKGSRGEPPTEYGWGSTPRVAMLREMTFSKGNVVKDWDAALTGAGVTTFRSAIRGDVDRAVIVTKSYKETEGQPWPIRRAKMMEKLCQEFPIFIKPGELIVGDPNSAPDEVRFYPEICVSYLPQAITEGGFREMFTEEEKKVIIGDIYEYWKDKCFDAVTRRYLPDDAKDYIDLGPYNPAGFCTLMMNGVSSYVFRYDQIFKEGIKGRMEKVEAKLAEHKASIPIGKMSMDEYLKKKDNWEAMIISGKALLRYAERYAELVEEEAKKEKDKARRKELEDMAERCKWVPANPPRTFHEALQFFWFCEVVVRFLNGGIGSPGRPDQFLYPYYLNDLKEERLTREKALELIECLFLKIQEVGAPIMRSEFFTVSAGNMILYAAGLGGTTVDGQDASNDLTCLMLEAMADIRTEQPALTFRYHPRVSPLVIDRVIDLLRAGMGQPAIFNEPLMEKYMLMRGHPVEAMKDVVTNACVDSALQGGRMGGGYMVGLGHSLPLKQLEIAMYQGLDKVSGLQIGARTPAPKTFKSAHDLLDAWLDQLEFYYRRYAEIYSVEQQVCAERFQMPMVSLVMDEPPEAGIDINELDIKYEGMGKLHGFSVTDVGDSLAAVQRLVFDEKKVTMEELVEACRTDWKDKEELRRFCLRAPKWGNDDDYADNWRKEAYIKSIQRTKAVKDAWGYPMLAEGSMLAAYIALSRGIGATPNGRRDGAACADGTISPYIGMDIKGPTAVLNSIAKLPPLHNELLNQRFAAEFLEGENRKLFADYLCSWYDAETFHIQFNTVSSETLRDAQQNPEKYEHLLIRVAAYVAYFIDLPREVQDSIIARTVQAC